MHWDYLRLSDQLEHRIHVVLAGCGGTGSAVLRELARMDAALRQLDHPGLFVTACDPDRVSEANLGRQLFYPPEVGHNKAAVLITRINRDFGLDWESRPIRIHPDHEHRLQVYGRRNRMLVSCVDSGAARVGLGQMVANEVFSLWLDFGNGRDFGQVVLGTAPATQRNCSFGTLSDRGLPESVKPLPTVLDLLPGAGQDDPDDGPSCSMAEALRRQDLFINTTLAVLGVGLIWDCIQNKGLDYHGLFLNLRTKEARPVPVDPNYWRRCGWELPAEWRSVLHLRLKRQWFDEIASGRKRVEFRARTDYWRKRLEDKHFDEIRFVNGYGSDRPWMRVAYEGLYKSRWNDEPAYALRLGEVLEIGNYGGRNT